MTDTALLVNGLNCTGCVGTLTKRLLQVPGVEHVSIDLVSGATSTVHISSNGDVNLATLEAAVVAAGKTVAGPECGEAGRRSASVTAN